MLKIASRKCMDDYKTVMNFKLHTDFWVNYAQNKATYK